MMGQFVVVRRGGSPAAGRTWAPLNAVVREE